VCTVWTLTRHDMCTCRQLEELAIALLQSLDPSDFPTDTPTRPSAPPIPTPDVPERVIDSVSLEFSFNSVSLHKYCFSRVCVFSVIFYLSLIVRVYSTYILVLPVWVKLSIFLVVRYFDSVSINVSLSSVRLNITFGCWSVWLRVQLLSSHSSWQLLFNSGY
jgi:hypothetical protein